MIYGSPNSIERDKELFSNDSKIIVPVLSDAKAHWCVNRLSFAYIYSIHTHKELLLGFNHNDLHKFDLPILRDFLDSEIYVYKKKYLYDLRHGENVFDAEMLYWYSTNQRFNLDVGPIIKRYRTDFKDYHNINDFIPIMKHLEYCREVRDKILTQVTKFEVTDSFRHYQKIADNLIEIELNGLYVKFN